MRTFLHVFVLFTVLSLGTALKCYVCNSHEHPECHGLPDTAKGYLHDCNERNSSVNYTMCRKLHMFMDQSFGVANPAEDRIHRDCGFMENVDVYLKGGTGCYYKSGYNTRTWVCSCDYDGCNAGMLGTAPSNILLMLLLGPTLLAARALWLV